MWQPRAQSDRPLARSTNYGMLRDRVLFFLNLCGLQDMITARQWFCICTLKNVVLLRNFLRLFPMIKSDIILKKDKGGNTDE